MSEISFYNDIIIYIIYILYNNLIFPLIGTKGLSPNHENQPQVDTHWCPHTFGVYGVFPLKRTEYNRAIKDRKIYSGFLQILASI